ncbi:MAG: aspartate/glutamate racemase family protein [Bacteroidales bacterium]
MITVVAIHTATPMVEPTRELFMKHLPEVRLVHIVDDTLIQDVIGAGKVPDEVKERLLTYYNLALNAGADLIFNTCSSVGDVAMEAKSSFQIPLIKIDDPMAEEAVTTAERIGVLATLSSTLNPTVRLLRSFAGERGKKIEIREGLAEGAFEAALSGDRERHDRLIMEAAVKLARDVEVFVLAQGSMARMEKQLELETGIRVLSSPERAVLKIKKILE